MKLFFKKVIRIMRFARPFWPFYVGVSLLALISQFVGLAQPYLMKVFLDDVLVNKKFELFLIIVIGFLVVYFVSQGLSIVSDLLRTKLSQKQQMHIRLEIYEHLQKLHLDFFYKKKVGDLLTRIGSDTMAIESFIVTVINTFFLSLINLIVIIYISLKLNASVTLLALAVFPAYILSEGLWVRRLKSYAQDLRVKGADLFSFLQEGLSGIKMVKVFTREREMSEEYALRLQDYNRLDYKSNVTRDLSSLVNGFIVYLPTFTVLIFGGRQVLLGLLSIGGLIALQQYIGRLFGPITSFVMLNRTLQLETVGINRVFEIFDAQPEVIDQPNAIELGRVRGRIEFRDVVFQYTANSPLLNGISGVIKPGAHIGLAGASGAGKSTLVNLLFRFYEPQTGSILLDDINVRDIKLKSLRSKIGFVSQESIIFHKSIKDNIAFGKPNATMEEITQAAKIAGIHDVIVKLPAQYETLVGERGEMLSGGERQRLSIARVVLEDPDIIVLDEPTSYLDSETEERVKGALDYVTKGKTTITIAHRLSTLKNVDEVWVLQGGRIRERGSFNELLRKKGEFFRYYLNQFGGFEMFRNRLEAELRRAEQYQKPFSLLEFRIANFADFDRDPFQGNARITDVLLELATNFDELYFASEVPQKRGTFFIALPETGADGAQAAIQRVQSLLKNKFPEITPVLNVIFTSDAVLENDVKQLEARLNVKD